MSGDVPAVWCEGLSKDYGGRPAVTGLSLAVAQGEFFGFLGPNGSGKSTTIKMLCGMVRPTSGRAAVLGLDPVHDSVRVKAAVGVLPEEVNTYERLTATELLVFTGRMHGLSRDESESRAADLLQLVQISEADRGKVIVDYSMGMRKKAALACALIHAPRVLFLDEPFNGIDAVACDHLRRVFTRLTERGVTIFFSSHVLEVVEKLCTRAAVIRDGRLVGIGTVGELRAQAGMGDGATLHDVFVKLVGGGGEAGDLAWLR